MSKLTDIIEEFNDLSNALEAQYTELREEPIAYIILNKQSLEQLIKGAFCVDNHIVTDIKFDGEDMKVSLEKI